MTSEKWAWQLPTPAIKVVDEHLRSVDNFAKVFAHLIIDHLRDIHKIAIPEGTRQIDFEKWLAAHYSKTPCDLLTGDLVRTFEEVCGERNNHLLVGHINRQLRNICVQEIDHQGVRLAILDE